jgi:hypothetical protein
MKFAPRTPPSRVSRSFEGASRRRRVSVAARCAGVAGGDAGERAGTDRVRCSRIQHIYNGNPEGLYYVLLLSRSYTNDRAGS